jgi:pentatricopeptide repeat protein
MYNTAISAAGKAGQLEVAVSLFSELSEPDAVSFETMIAAYGMCGYVAKAEAMMRAMRGKGYRPRDYAYCGLIAAYSLSGDWQSALNIRARILKDNMQVRALACRPGADAWCAWWCL